MLLRRGGIVERFTPAGSDGAYTPAVTETHSGVVFFAGDRAYKLKKAVDLGFLDFTTREHREAACHREVALNRRLAPDVYLGVADVHDAAGEACDHLVVMRRMPVGRRLSTLVLDGSPVHAVLDDVARLVASFHARAERSPDADRAAGADALAARWSANTAGLQPFTGRFVDAADVAAVDRLAHRYLAGRRALFRARVADGRACDGHGDLLADDIFCLDDGPRILDCLEFDDALRLDDVLADVAFLAMDLERLGRPDLADRVLAAYRAASGDEWPASLTHHHVAHRAQVRAKVSAIRADQGVADSAATAQRLLELALAHLDAGRVRLVLVGGLPGTGKSTLARGLGEAAAALVLRSDVVRKELAGLRADRSAGARFGEGIYTATATAATYRELLARAEHALGMGHTVVLDASWTDADRRADARRVAEITASDLIELRCVAPPDVVADRISARTARGGDASDADTAIATAMATVADPWPTSVAIDTVVAPASAVQAALRHVGPTSLSRATSSSRDPASARVGRPRRPEHLGATSTPDANSERMQR
jgi:aminoglycoside phosphotransferase family enzyme/predicted kinase